MVLLYLAGLAMEAAASGAAVDRCRAALERKLGGTIETLSVTTQRQAHGAVLISGQVTAAIGMAPPQPGHASADHLIRTDFLYRCRVRRGIVRSVKVSPLR